MKNPCQLAEIMRGKSIDSYDGGDAALFDSVAEQLECLARIYAELDGRDWSADSAANIADYLGAVGLECLADLIRRIEAGHTATA